MIKFASSSKLVLLYFISICLIYIIFVPLEMRINWTSNIQSNFIIDGFYYAKIGYEYKINSFHDIINNPVNPSSAGVVLINILYANIVPLHMYPIVNISILILILSVFYTLKSSLFFAMAILIFMPYFMLVTKEYLIMVGLLLFFTPKMLMRCLGYALIVLGRPESALILAFSYLIVKSYKSRWQFPFWCICGSIILMYFLVRSDVYNISYAFQQVALESSYSCKFPVFETCLNSLATMEYVFLNRIMISVLLPIKWILDIINNQSVFSIQYAVGAIFIFLFATCSKYPKKIIIQQPILSTFCLLNIVVYVAILFIAPSRPVLFHMFLLIVFSLLEAKKSPWGWRNG